LSKYCYHLSFIIYYLLFITYHYIGCFSLSRLRFPSQKIFRNLCRRHADIIAENRFRPRSGAPKKEHGGKNQRRQPRGKFRQIRQIVFVGHTAKWQKLPQNGNFAEISKINIPEIQTTSPPRQSYLFRRPNFSPKQNR